MAHDKRQYEAWRDTPQSLLASVYTSVGYGMHFHRNVEIYGVVKGEVCVRIAGEERVLTDGQMAIVNCMEMHSYAVKESAEIFFVHIGSQYLTPFYTLYQHQLLPRWLLDEGYNRSLYAQVQTISNGEFSPLKKYGITSCLLSDIISYYGLGEGRQDGGSHDLVEQVIQYVYEHYAEKITLQSLANTFCIEAKTLSKKLFCSIGVDLRVFVNDVRAQRAIQMHEDPQYKHLSLKEIGKLCGFQSQDTFYKVYKRNLEY